VQIGADSFTGLIVDLTAKKTRPEEKMEFPILDLSEDDRSLFCPCAAVGTIG
jgi:hypothetical protein